MKKDGFTLVEILIAVTIIGILAVIAIPSFISYRQRGHETLARSDIKNAFTTAKAYFNDYPDATVTVAKLQQVGFHKSAGVNLNIVSGLEQNLSFTAVHENGGKTFSINALGTISE